MCVFMCVHFQAVAGRSYEGKWSIQCFIVPCRYQEGPQREWILSRISSTLLPWLISDSVLCSSVSWPAGSDWAGSHEALWGNQSGVLGRVCKVRWEPNRQWSSLSAFHFLLCPLSKLCPPWLCFSPGAGVKDFFFRVASLTFEANVLSELERSGSRHVGDIISESVLTEDRSFSGC